MSFDNQNSVENNGSKKIISDNTTSEINEYILNSRYLNHKTGEKSFDEICKRVCFTVCPNDNFLYKQLLKHKWCPGGRTLAYVGTDQPVSANCLVLPLHAELSQIIETLCRALLLQKHGMGIGFSFSNINNSSFQNICPRRYNPNIINIYGETSRRQIPIRKFALSIYHPDVLSFIEAKFIAYEKMIVLPNDYLMKLYDQIFVRRVNYNPKFTMQIPEIIYSGNSTISELIKLAEQNSCKIITEEEFKQLDNIYCPHDNMDSILNVLREISFAVNNNEQVIIDITKLRMAGAICDEVIKSGGPVSFAFIYDTITNTINHIEKSNAITWLYVFSACSNIIMQNNRNGANIGVLDCDHESILDFINVKRNQSVINNFNISIRFTDEFMKTIVNSDKYSFRFINNCNYDENFIIKNCLPEKISTKAIWEAFIESAYDNGEPGCIFEDNVNKRYKFLHEKLGKITACNPCGEIMMWPNEVCNLASINLEEFVSRPTDLSIPNKNNNDDYSEYLNFIDGIYYKRFITNFQIDEFNKTVKHVIIFLNEIVDRINVPDEKVIKQVRLLRRLGLGIMGFANMLLKLRIPYESPAARNIAEYITNCMAKSSHEQSVALAEKYGSIESRLGLENIAEQLRLELHNIYTDGNNFIEEYSDNLFGRETESDRINYIRESLNILAQANIATLCCAPTGSTAMLFNTSYSIEPEFKMCYKKKIYIDKEQYNYQYYVNKYLKEFLEENNLYNEENLIEISSYGVGNAMLTVNESKDLFTTSVEDDKVFKSALEISPINHLLMQSALQKNIDNSISKTINFSHDAKIDDINNLFISAWKNGIKGTTVYRDNSRDSQVLVSISDKENPDNEIHCKSGKCDV